MKTNEAYSNWVAAAQVSPEALAKARDELGEALFYYIRAIIASNFGNRFNYLEDALGESAHKIISHIGEYNSAKGNFASWVYGVTVNTCTDMLRLKTRQSEQVLTDSPLYATKPTHFERLFLETLLKDLDEDERELLDLKANDVSNEDIAAQFDTSEGAIKMKWSRLQEKLRTVKRSRLRTLRVGNN